MCKKFWMVLGEGTPSFRHSSKYSAHTEAQRLAKQYPNEAFIVLEAVAVCKLSQYQWSELEDPITTLGDESVPF